MGAHFGNLSEPVAARGRMRIPSEPILAHLEGKMPRPFVSSVYDGRMCKTLLSFILALIAPVPQLFADDSGKVPDGYTLQHAWDFSDEKSLDSFEFSDPAAWRLVKSGERSVLELYRGSKYRYKVDSPQSIGLLATRKFGDFVLECELRQTSQEYGHRDFCVFFGFQNPGHYYYAHFATTTDPKANQIFVVDEKPFTKISKITNAGNAWGDGWHRVRLERKGVVIKVYFDNMDTPVMVAEDGRFGVGYVGFGSYNDTGMVAKARIWAPTAQTVTVERPGTLFEAEKP
jgi:hypothetical protein